MLQKTKAAGYNATSIYFDWGYHSPKPGVYDFSGVRDVDELLRIASQVGIYVIARPGPYINAETDSGGFPAWLDTQKGRARSSAPDYTAACTEWLGHIDPIIARHQITNGTGTVLLYQVENEYGNNTDATYMEQLEQKIRAGGITVPLTHNHCCGPSTWATGPGAVDLPGQDSYPRASTARIPLSGAPSPPSRGSATTLRSSPLSSRVARSTPGAVLAMTSAANSPDPTSRTCSTRRTSPTERRCRTST